MESDLEAAADAAGPWFGADDGLTWVRTLRAHLEAKPSAVKDAAAVLADLAEYEEVLLRAKAAGANWRLSVDF